MHHFAVNSQMFQVTNDAFLIYLKYRWNHKLTLSQPVSWSGFGAKFSQLQDLLLRHSQASNDQEAEINRNVQALFEN